LEGASAIAGIAKRNFEKLRLDNVRLLQGNFEETLPSLLLSVKITDFVFIDGNHRREPTLAYFNQLVSFSTNSTISILDDIHWSKEMEEAWNQVKQHPAVTLTIDLFFIGIVCINTNIKTRQHFVIRF
jgi:predicted O-methyltransferase YrrM